MRVLRFTHQFHYSSFKSYTPWQKPAEIEERALGKEDFEKTIEEVKNLFSWWVVVERPDEVPLEGSEVGQSK